MKKRCVLLCLTACLLAACAADAPHTRTVFAMDTVMNLTAYGADATAALDAAAAELERLDALLARDRLDADDAETAALAAEAEAIAAATDGAFDLYLGGVLDLWGFGSGAGEHRVPTDDELAAAPRLLDLGGVAKGYAGRRAADVLRENGVASAVIDLGGDVALLGNKPDGNAWRVAIKDPADGVAYLGILETAGDVYVATSGVYERYFEADGVRYHHILDPETGYPADSGVVSATVICGNGVWADALATACCVLGADGALALRAQRADTTPFELILVTDDGRVRYTCGGFAPETGNGYAYEFVG